MLIIKTAGLNDIADIRSIAGEVWPRAYGEILSPEQLEYMLALFYSEESLAEQFTRHEFLMAFEDESPVGFASYSAIDDGIFKLHKLYVRSKIQSKGVGRQMIQAILEKIRPLGAVALELNVNRHNKAKGFYEKLGFRVIREEDIDIGEGYWMNDYVMRLEPLKLLEK